MPVTIRPAIVSDSEFIRHVLFEAAALAASDFNQQGWLSLRNTNTLDTWNQRLVSDDFMTWVAEQEGNLVGYICLYQNHKLYHLFVLPEFHNQGIASALWQLAKEHLQHKGADSVIVNASSFAVPVYQKFGFVATSETIEYMGITSLPMRLQL